MRFAIAAALALLIVAPATAHEYKLGDIEIVHPWARATPAGASVAVGYIKALRNGGAEDALVGVSADVATKAQVHETKTESGVMAMRPVASLTLAAKASLELKPGGAHIMFTGLKAPFKPGDKIEATLTFAHAGSVKVYFLVEAVGAAEPGAMGDMPGMEMK